MRDLGSGNGTLRQRRARIDSVILDDGDQIELGNTLMRFDHGRRGRRRRPAQHGPPAASVRRRPAPPPPYARPRRRTRRRRSAGADRQSPIAGMAPSPVDTPSEQQCSGLSPRASREAVALDRPLPAALAPPLPSAKTRLIAFGVMGGLSLVSLIVIVTKTAFAKPAVVASDAEAALSPGPQAVRGQGLRRRQDQLHRRAAASAPESTDVKRYVSGLRLEVHARGAMQTAERAVDEPSLRRGGQGARRRRLRLRWCTTTRSGGARSWRPRRRPTTSKRRGGCRPKIPTRRKARLQQALALDPGNPDARALAPQAARRSAAAAGEHGGDDAAAGGARRSRWWLAGGQEPPPAPATEGAEGGGTEGAAGAEEEAS